MAIWLIRAGSHVQYEQKFIQENRRLCDCRSYDIST